MKFLCSLLPSEILYGYFSGTLHKIIIVHFVRGMKYGITVLFNIILLSLLLLTLQVALLSVLIVLYS